jgi:hypothetical protein
MLLQLGPVIATDTTESMSVMEVRAAIAVPARLRHSTQPPRRAFRPCVRLLAPRGRGCALRQASCGRAARVMRSMAVDGEAVSTPAALDERAAAPRGLGIVITGATKGFGFALAMELLALGDRLVICGRDKQRTENAVAALRSAHPGELPCSSTQTLSLQRPVVPCGWTNRTWAAES